jgi:regulator of protease activity HflC (stomatin/prohibitin superfamily)
MYFDSDSPTPFLIKVGGASLLSVLIIGVLAWGLPQFGVYNRTLAGKAALMEAESTRQVRVLEAKAKMDSASLEAKAEIERAKGVAEANKIIGDSLKDNPRYLQYLYITGLQEGSANGNRTIYVPTEGGLPVPTLGIEK